MPSDLQLKIALGLTRGISISVLERMSHRNISHADFFALSDKELTEALGLAPGVTFPEDTRRKALERAASEMEFTERHGISALLVGDEDYPRRLLDCPDAPPLLFKFGSANLNNRHAVDFVGTRNATPYGINFCDKAISDIAQTLPDCLIVSGLAYGIDAAAHKAALCNNLPTVAVVAHGLDSLYPAAHRGLAQSILDAGGAIVSEYTSGTSAHRQNFLQRNRIIAALSDVTVVAESDIKGGALTTARHAYQYGRDVAALPGRTSDQFSSGCNKLIANGRAQLVSSGKDILKMLGADIHLDAIQQTLSPILDDDQQAIYDVLKNAEHPLTPDQILPHTDLNIAILLSQLNEMALDGLLLKHPGNRFSTAF